MFLYFGASKCFYLVRNKQFLHLEASNVSVWSGASKFLALGELLSQGVINRYRAKNS